MRPTLTMCALAALLGLAACGERPQNLGSAPSGSTPAWQGTTDGNAAPGWKAGDKASWENQIQQRATSQNEYVRIGG